jgi:transcriptional regulator with XRE-family HTH domain
MARAALNLAVRDLAELADVAPNTIARLERGDGMHSRTVAHVQGALEAEGIIFIDPNSMSAWGGEGIRLGNGIEKSAMGKLFEAMWAATDARITPAQTYTALLDICDQYLDIVHSQGREPDVWERLSLNDALRMLNRGEVHYAASYFWHAITPPDNQSKDYPIDTETAATVAPLDLNYFRRAVRWLRDRGFQRPHYEAESGALHEVSGRAL